MDYFVLIGVLTVLEGNGTPTLHLVAPRSFNYRLCRERRKIERGRGITEVWALSRLHLLPLTKYTMYRLRGVRLKGARRSVCGWRWSLATAGSS